MSGKDINPSEVCNINVGVMGHVDSGKTSLVKALSVILSTASLDKNPQSRQRGITLDLGFSAFLSNMPSSIPDTSYKYIQYTLVDCPGHASLIRTILGGAQIIDMLLIVIDCMKGIQAQTAECMVIGEITTDKVILVLNKIDLIPEAERETRIPAIINNIKKVISKTRFKNAPIIPVSAQVGGGSIEDVNTSSIGMSTLTTTIQNMITLPNKDDPSPLYFVYDHLFTIAGKGCVMTGTVLAGALHVGDDVEFPGLHLTRKVKSIQMFHKNIDCVKKGDRAGVCVQAFDIKGERGEVCSIGSLAPIQNVIIRLKKIRFYKGEIQSGATFHISIGHHTIPAVITLFTDHTAQEKLNESRFGAGVFSEEVNSFDLDKSYEYTPAMTKPASPADRPVVWALLQLEHAVYAPLGSLLIGSQLNTAATDTACRIAFYAKAVQTLPAEKEALKALRVYKPKVREASVDRVVSEYEVIGTNLTEKGGSVAAFVGLHVVTKDGVQGTIDAPFGKTGKFKVSFRQEHHLSKNDALAIHFRRYIFDKEKKIHQE
ncbi:selenocysteine-specific elongation factor [Blastocystis sp. ATCC 50177/Nand II]|uniref:Elongation factor Tu, chloroplastic n=1 Tax=Blastocystis sp. subtype 1 (strain ATCC 50177 / NandII) TaxID=478820 RepID=A0A196SKG1_BLAHN|nr:selenocysteine-specific elongation factor [Blastocystis sp. ATCC 50177/Nand II]